MAHAKQCVSLIISLSLSPPPPGGLAQRADVGAEASHSAASASQHSGGLGEQLAGRRNMEVTAPANHLLKNIIYLKIKCYYKLGFTG